MRFAVWSLLPLMGLAQEEGKRKHPPRPPDWRIQPVRPVAAPIEWREEHVQLTVRDGVVERKIRTILFNPNPSIAEADLLVPLEPETSIDRFRSTIGGKELEAELVDSEKARRIYEEIVRRRKDPALLEYYGHQLLRLRVFPIPANSPCEVQVELLHPVRPSGDVYRIHAFQGAGGANPRAVQKLTLVADLEMSRPLRLIYSPTHEIAVSRATDRKARIRFERNDYTLTGPLAIYYSMSEDPIGAALLTHAEPGEDPFFMLTLSPRWEVKPDERMPRDVVFVIDTSGSMIQDNKMEQVKEALRTCLRSLAAGEGFDRFGIVTFSTEVLTWRESLCAANAENVRDAIRFVETLRARGGTAIHDALRTAFRMLETSDALPFICFLTDGNPTIGEIQIDKIRKDVESWNRKNVRLFAFGVGIDINSQFLDALALSNGGDRDYVRPNEDARDVLEAFARKIDSPVLASPSVRFEAIEVQEIYPRKLSDIFRGGQVTILGRFRGGGEKTIRLSGEFLGRKREYVYSVSFDMGNHSFIPRLWAVKKVDFLIDQIRLNGVQKELVDELSLLARKYGIVTPYTSYLIVEDEHMARPGEPGEPPPVPTPTSALPGFVESHRRKFEGRDDREKRQELAKAKNQAEWRGAECEEACRKASAQAVKESGEYSAAAAERNLLAKARSIDGRQFYSNGVAWVDARYDAKKKYDRVFEVKFDSEEYFALLRERPHLAKYLALGENVIVEDGNECLMVK